MTSYILQSLILTFFNMLNNFSIIKIRHTSRSQCVYKILNIFNCECEKSRR
nr:MAG TPA: hypothetical protein [Caudoviricetes sp.]